jgi:NitT/TauT family transport system permease protein
MVFFVVFYNIYSGIMEVDPDLINNARVLGANRLELLRHIFFPAALGWIFSGLRISVGMAVVGAIIGEYMGSMKGLGNVIVNAQAFYQIDKIFAGLLLILIVRVESSP